MRSHTPCCLLLFLLCAPVPGVAADAGGFTGVWKLDRTRSQVAGRMESQPIGIAQTVTIQIDGDKFTVVTRTPAAPADRQTTTEVQVLDGKARDFTPPPRAGTRSARGKRIAAWSADHNIVWVIEDITREADDGTTVSRHVKHSWSLSPDGRTLTNTSAIQSGQSEVATERIFIRPPPPAPVS